MIQLLSDLTTDVQETESGSQLRQVIINTHSPSVVMQVPDESLVMAESVDNALRLRCLPGTWRHKASKLEPVSKGALLAYLNPVARASGNGWDGNVLGQIAPDKRRARRVIDREDLRQYTIPFAEISE